MIKSMNIKVVTSGSLYKTIATPSPVVPIEPPAAAIALAGDPYELPKKRGIFHEV